MTRYWLGGAALVLIVAAVTWVTMFMPGRTTVNPPPSGSSQPQSVLRFTMSKDTVNNAVWYPNMPAIARPYEVGVPGFFDFPFENPSAGNVELGFYKPSCDCAGVEVALVPEDGWKRYSKEVVGDKEVTGDPWHANPDPSWTWTKLPRHETEGIVVSPGAKGFLRVTWTSRKNIGEQLNLNITMWIQPQGRMEQRAFEKFRVPIVMSAPLEFAPEKVSVSVLGAKDTGRAEFVIWSISRDDLNLKIAPKGIANPNFVHELKKISPADLRGSQGAKPGADMYARSAYRLTVTVHEQAGSNQLDLGPFYYHVPLLLDDEPWSAGSPMVHGTVKGIVEIGTDKDAGRINLKSFAAKDGIRMPVPFITNDGTTELAVAEQELTYLEVKLRKVETKGNRTHWLLEVTVPPDAAQGDFPEHAAVILRTQTTPPRYVRIPIVGIAVTG